MSVESIEGGSILFNVHAREAALGSGRLEEGCTRTETALSNARFQKEDPTRVRHSPSKGGGGVNR